MMLSVIKTTLLIPTFSSKTFLPCENASCIHADPTLGAPSLSTQSAFHVFNSLFSRYKTQSHKMNSY